MAATGVHPLRLGLRGRLSATGAGAQRAAAATLNRWWTWVIFVGLLWALPLGRSLTRALPPEPPVLAGVVPAFHLTTENGEALSSDDLPGRMWIVRFAAWDAVEDDAEWGDAHVRLQHRLRNMGESARILTVTTDPEHDTVDRLYAYARAYHANPYQWTFATGDAAELHETLSAALRQAQPDLLADSTLADSRYFVLLDPGAHIRGFYAPDAAGFERMIADCGLVANFYEPAREPEGSAS